VLICYRYLFNFKYHTKDLDLKGQLILKVLEEHKYLGLARGLMRQIRDTQLQPGDRLGTEEELGRAYRVSRVTVRQALSLLQQEGVVSRKKRIGTLVKSIVNEGIFSDWQNTVAVLCSNQVASHLQDYAAFTTILRSFETILGSKGYRVQILGLGVDENLDRIRLRSLSRQSDISGICAIDLSLQPYLNCLPDVPVVSTRSSSDPNILSIGPDWVEGARICVCHLLEHGHRDIAMVCGSELDQQIFARLSAGYRNAFIQAGEPVDRGFFHQCCPGEDIDTAVCEILCGRVTKPTAVFAQNSLVCEAVVRAANAKNLKIPSDLSLVGFGQNVLHIQSPVRITAYVPDNEAIGRRAAELLAKHPENGLDSPQFISVDGKLVQGSSVASQEHRNNVARTS
jgi:GntR family transcriptional regulator of arabinose operon